MRLGKLEYKWVASTNTTLGMLMATMHTALVHAFVFAIVACLVAAVASLLRGGKYHYVEATSPMGAPTGSEPVEPDVPETSRLPARRTAEETG